MARATVTDASLPQVMFAVSLLSLCIRVAQTLGAQKTPPFRCLGVDIYRHFKCLNFHCRQLPLQAMKTWFTVISEYLRIIYLTSPSAQWFLRAAWDAPGWPRHPQRNGRGCTGTGGCLCSPAGSKGSKRRSWDLLMALGSSDKLNQPLCI